MDVDANGPRWTWQPLRDGSTLGIVRFWRGDTLVDLHKLDLANAGNRGLYVERMREHAPEVQDLASTLLAFAQQASLGTASGDNSAADITLLDCADAWSKDDRTPVVPTGLPWCDRPMEGGLPIGGIVALVAYPNIGKSPLAIQWTLSALIHDPTLHVVYGLGEMNRQGFAGRVACAGAALLGSPEPITMKAARLRTPEARAALVKVCEAVGPRLHVVPAPLTLDGIEHKVVKTRARLVVVDYLQLIRSPEKTTDRVQELDHIIGRIRDMAIERECAVIAISSMAKSAGSSSRIGQLAKGSGEIDYAVELAYVGTHPEVDHEGKPVVASDGTTGVTWQCKKARNLELLDLELRFDGDTQTYNEAIEFPEFARFAQKAV